MKLSGHRTRSVFDRYNIVSEEDLFEAALDWTLCHKHSFKHSQPKMREVETLQIIENKW